MLTNRSVLLSSTKLNYSFSFSPRDSVSDFRDSKHIFRMHTLAVWQGFGHEIFQADVSYFLLGKYNNSLLDQADEQGTAHGCLVFVGEGLDTGRQLHLPVKALTQVYQVNTMLKKKGRNGQQTANKQQNNR